MRLKKRLGQHVLVDDRWARYMVERAQVSRDDVVVEIGAGTGRLTGPLAERAGSVRAIEVDPDMVAVLERKLARWPNVTVVAGDVLALDLTALVRSDINEGRRAKVVASLPYYISTPVITKILDSAAAFSIGVLMVQREVAERVAAKPGSREYGALSVYAQYRGVPEVGATVPREAFRPRPRVDSAVLIIRLKPQPAVRVADEQAFFSLVRSSFRYRRKMMRAALREAYGPVTAARIAACLAEAGIDPTARPEELGVEEFGSLANAVARAEGDLLDHVLRKSDKGSPQLQRGVPGHDVLHKRVSQLYLPADHRD